MISEGIHYDRACAVAREVMDLLAPAYPGRKAELFAKVLFLVLDAMHEVQGRTEAAITEGDVA